MASLLRLRVLMTPSTGRLIFSQNAVHTANRALAYRQIHTTRRVLNTQQKEAPTPASTTTTPSPSTPAPAPTPATEPKKPLWDRIKHEVNHYWDGTKLLGLEMKISFKLALKSVAGYELTRRENKQLQRTTQDIVRLVPFSMFVIVPFAELLLPIALKVFPGLLPSTYESSSDREKKVTSLRDTRKKVSTLLRDTVKVQLPSTVTEEQKADFREFIQQLKTGMEPPSKEQTLRVARLFKDDNVLDNLEKPQLVAMSRYLNLQPIGTNEMLRFRIRYKLLNIKNDDRAIDYEGVDSLTTMEAQAACAARGIRINNVNSITLRHDLEMWLNLRLRDHVPSTLLMLSNAYTYGNLEKEESIYEALQAVLSSMPEQVHHVVEADVDTDMTNKQRLELLKEQEELIHTETKQEIDTGVKIPVKDKINLDDVDAAHDLAEAEAEAEAGAEVEASTGGETSATDAKPEDEANVEKTEEPKEEPKKEEPKA